MRCYSHLWNFAWTCQHRILDTDFSTLWYHASIPGKTMCCRFPWWRIKPSSCVYEPVCFLSNFGHRTIHGVRSWIVRIDQDLEGIIRVWRSRMSEGSLSGNQAPMINPVSYQISPPEEFNFSKPTEWIKWIRRFERFHSASGLSNLLLYGYHQRENTGSRLFTAVKPCWTGLISGWVTI